jgi:hypothetical protein
MVTVSLPLTVKTAAVTVLLPPPVVKTQCKPGVSPAPHAANVPWPVH